MSAIAGLYSVDGCPADPDLLRRMLDALAYRGPDGEGQWVAGPIGLGHRLLSTTPESLNEKQPVTDERGESSLVWDGRLDNREELVGALKAKGQLPRDQSDPALVLEAYRLWGTDSLKRIVGEFALALWDQRTRSLVCARDPIGVKPFYYHWNGNRFRFGSEVKALFTDPTIAKRPNEATIADYLLMGFRDPEATFFEGIKQLRPAHFLCVGERGLRLERYWDVDPSRQVRYTREEEYLEAFRELFREAVRCRLRSNSPVGVLLSGGIDSTLVSAMAETLRRSAGDAPALAAFTLLAEGVLQEEWEAIQRLVETYGTEIHPIRPESRNGPVTFFELFLDCAETPHHDAFFTIPDLLGPAAVKGCRVLLTGVGADELSQHGEEGFLADLLRSVRVGRLAREARLSTIAYGGEDWRRILLLLLWAQLPPQLRRLIKTWLKQQVPRWFEAEFAKRVKLEAWTMPSERRKLPTLCQEKTYRALTGPSMALALNQMDGMASAFSLESRHPYLDRRLIEFFLSVPSPVKMMAGYRKQFVQRAMVGITPGPIRDKEGREYFIPPMDQQTCNGLEGQRLARDLFDPQALVFRYISRLEAERMMERYVRHRAPYRNLLWSFVRLELWLRQWFPQWSPLQGGVS